MKWIAKLAVVLVSLAILLTLVGTAAPMAVTGPHADHDAMGEAGTCYAPCPYCYPPGPHCYWNAGHSGRHMCESNWNHIY